MKIFVLGSGKIYDRVTISLTAATSPAPVSSTERMFWLFQSLPLVFCLGPGHVVSQESSTPSIMNGVLGELVTLPLKFPTGEKAMSITWLYSGTSIAFIRLKEDQSSESHVTDPKRRERLSFTGCCSLQLSNLMMADTGSYRAQIATETSTKFFNYTLRIFEKLRNIQVTNHIQLTENKTCEIHLACFVENSSDTVAFTWQTSGNIHQHSPNFTISWDPRNSSEDNYTCIAENPVSNLSLSVSAQALCKGIKKNPDSDSIWIIGTTVFAVILISAVLLCCIVWRRIGRFSFLILVCSPRYQGFRVERPMGWWAEDSHHFSPQQAQGPAPPPRNTENASVSPGSSTVYASVTHPNSNREMESPTPMENNDSVTIYSTINHSRESKPTSPRATALDNVV
ncbi:SLAM family member 6 [Otolemur garnettii]|uniref:SLAM family member 6 n=1 Tax=Otolemur garnettii TaxID=30611 RepID=UPI000C7F51BF|nr:SLAM family member 6 [Otolemur garnettii]